MDPGQIFTIDKSSTITCLLASNHHHLPHHTINPLLQQTGELDNLTVRWDKVLSLCCAGFHVACNTFETFRSSYWFDNLGFLLRENLLLCSSHLALWVSNEASHDNTGRHHQAFLAPLPGRLRTSSQGESS